MSKSKRKPKFNHLTIDNISTSFNNDNKYYLYGTSSCLVCNNDLEIIEILNKYKLLLYCNHCKTFHTINIKDKEITGYPIFDFKKEVFKVKNFNKISVIYNKICYLFSFLLFINSLYSLFFKGRWIETLVFISMFLISLNSVITKKYKLKKIREQKFENILDNVKYNSISNKLVHIKGDFNFLDKGGVNHNE